MREHEQSQTLPLPFGERPEIRFKADLNAVELLPVRPGEEPRIAFEAGLGGRLPVEVRKEGNVVRVELLTSGFSILGFGRRQGSVTLYLPEGLSGSIYSAVGSIRARSLSDCDLELRSDAGRIQVSGLRGRVRLDSSAGRIEASDLGPGDFRIRSDAGRVSLERVRGHIQISTGAGRVDADALSGSLDVQSDLGTVRLAVLALDAGEHRVRTHAGSIRIELARELSVRIDASAALGSTRIDYPSRADAAAILRCHADAGSIRIQKGDFAAPSAPERAPERPNDVIALPAAQTAAPPEPERKQEPDPAAAAAQAERRAAADSEIERILKLVEAGELSPEDADELLRALEEQ